ncbi:hypothetical protein D3C73_1346310 [compost metagenome]
MQEAADWHLAGIQLSEERDVAGTGLLHHYREAVALWLADGDLAALGDGLAGGDLQLVLVAVGLDQLEHHLKLAT